MKHEVTSQNTKKMLAETLKSLMQKKSLSKITVSEIVNACQINRKTFYYHFTDIYDLFEWHLDQEIETLLYHYNILEDFNKSLERSLTYLDENTYLLSCADDPIGCEKLSQFFNKRLYPIAFNVISQMEEQKQKYLNEDYKFFLASIFAKTSSLFLVDTIKNKNNLDRERNTLYLSATFRGALEGLFL